MNEEDSTWCTRCHAVKIDCGITPVIKGTTLIVHAYKQGKCTKCEHYSCQYTGCHDYQIEPDLWVSTNLGDVSTSKCRLCNDTKTNAPVDHKYENNKCVRCGRCKHAFVPKGKHGDYWYTLDAQVPHENMDEEVPELVETFVRSDSTCEKVEQKRMIKEAKQNEPDMCDGDTMYVLSAIWYKKMENICWLACCCARC